MQNNNQEKYPLIEVLYVRYFKNQHFYPNNTFTKHLMTLMRRKSFTSEEIAYFRGMGFTVDISMPTVPPDCLTATTTTLKPRAPRKSKQKAEVE